MRSYITVIATSKAQSNLYSKLNEFSNNHTHWGRLFSIPVSIADVILETGKTPLNVIEYAAMTAINLFGALFIENCSLKDSLCNLEFTLINLKAIPVAVVMLPFKIIYQIFASIFNPANIKSINFDSYIKKSEPWFYYEYLDENNESGLNGIESLSCLQIKEFFTTPYKPSSEIDVYTNLDDSDGGW